MVLFFVRAQISIHLVLLTLILLEKRNTWLITCHLCWSGHSGINTTSVLGQIRFCALILHFENKFDRNSR